MEENLNPQQKENLENQNIQPQTKSFKRIGLIFLIIIQFILATFFIYLGYNLNLRSFCAGDYCDPNFLPIKTFLIALGLLPLVSSIGLILKKKWGKILSIFFGILLLILGSYLIFKYTTQIDQPIKEKSVSLEESTANWQTYRNDEFGFEVKYPRDYRISDSRGTNIGKSLESDYAFIDFGEIDFSTQGKKIKINNADGFELPVGGNRDGGIDFDVRFQTNKPSTLLQILFSTNQEGFESKIEEFRKILSTFKFIKEGPSKTVTPQNSLSWDEAVILIRDCKVESIFQYHNLNVTLYLKDGTRYTTKEPQIDLVVKEAQEASKKCGYHIPIATE